MLPFSVEFRQNNYGAYKKASFMLSYLLLNWRFLLFAEINRGSITKKKNLVADFIALRKSLVSKVILWEIKTCNSTNIIIRIS